MRFSFSTNTLRQQTAVKTFVYNFIRALHDTHMYARKLSIKSHVFGKHIQLPRSCFRTKRDSFLSVLALTLTLVVAAFYAQRTRLQCAHNSL